MPLRVYYEILKRVGREWEYWDGAYSTLKSAKMSWKQHYAPASGEDSLNDFIIVKVTEERVYPTPRKRKR